MAAPTRFDTARLTLRRPERRDADAIFYGYASDEAATRFMAWPCHRSLQDTLKFLEFSDAAWEDTAAGPYLIESRESGQVVGSTGLDFETRHRASTGYILSREAWGKGFATEAVLGIVGLCPSLGVVRLHAHVHHEHEPSCRVLEKCGFKIEGVLSRYLVFPNLGREPRDVVSYSRIFRESQYLA